MISREIQILTEEKPDIRFRIQKIRGATRRCREKVDAKEYIGFMK